MNVKMESPKWLLIASLQLLVIFLSEVIFLASAVQSVGHKNSVMPPYNSLSTKEALHRRLLKGREVIPPMSSNALPGEPTCEELRAMWRYYKRQSRAELTNEIPRFGSNPFWDILPVAQHQPQISSFGPLKGRSRARLRLKNKSQAYGRVMLKPEKERDRARKPRPMEQVAQLMGKSKADESGKVKSKGGASQEPIVHLSPPATPTKASSFQQIKEVFREDRIREKAPPMTNDDNNGPVFGRIILSPPKGMDGRMANKPRELMTPFEQIRFGHADDILDDGAKPNLNLMAKRRTNFLPVLNTQSQHQQQPQYYSSIPQELDFNPQSGQQRLIFTQANSPPLPQENSNNFLPISSNEDQGTINIIDQYQLDQQPSWAPLSLRQQDNNNEDTTGNGMMMSTGPIQNRRAIPFQQFPNLPIMMEKPTCSEVEGQPCRGNSDCACVGFGLYRCYVEQCQVISLLPSARVVEQINPDVEDSAPSFSSSSSFWHTNPVERNKLGLWEETPTGLRLVANPNNNNNFAEENLGPSSSQDSKKDRQSLPSDIVIMDGDSSKSSQDYIKLPE